MTDKKQQVNSSETTLPESELVLENAEFGTPSAPPEAETSAHLQAALQDSEQRYRELAESADDSIFIINREFRLDYVNKAGAKEHSSNPTELLGKPVSELFPPDIFGKMKSSLQKIMETKKPFSMERLFAFPTGEKWLDTRLIPLLNDNGQVKAILGIARDTTERKRVEMTLAESEEKYRKLLELANDAIFVADAETGTVVEANQKGGQLIGRPLSEIIGMHRSKLHPPDKAEQYEEICREHIAKGQGLTMEVLVRHASGCDIPAEISASVFKLGEKLLIIGIFRDLSIRKRANELRDFLNEINAVASSKLNIFDVMDEIISTTATAIGADSAAFFLLEGNHWVLEQVHGRSPDKIGTKIPYDTLDPPPRMAENPAPLAISDMLNDDRANKEMAQKIGLRSLLLVPLVFGERVLGMLVFRYFTKQMEFTREEVDFATKLGVSISLSLENARLFSEQQEIASTLQESLLVVPEDLPHVEFGHLYRSASEAAMVGGDFYDLFALQGDKIGVVIGDVSGKGLGAAALTSTLKHTIRGYAYEGHAPGEIITKTNVVTMKETDSSTFVTAFVGILDTQSGILTYCCAGHPPPIIKRQKGDIDVLDAGGPPLGVLDFLDRPDDQQRLNEGDLLTLYTDGVIEARCATYMFSEKRLIDYLQNTTALLAAEAPGRILDELIRCGCTLSDDLAVVSLSLNHSSPSEG